MTPQSSFMIVVPVLPDKLADLMSVLDSMNQSNGLAIPDNPLIPFSSFTTLHSARLLIIEALTKDEIREFGWQPHNWPPSLALLGEVDGDADDFLAEFAIRASAGLSTVFTYCQDFAKHKGTMLSFLKLHSTPSAATYVNWIGRTVEQILEESKLQQSLSQKLATLTLSSPEKSPEKPVRQLRQELLSHAQYEIHKGALTLTAEQPASMSFRLRNTLDLVGFPVLLLIISPILIFALPFILWRLRCLENSDPDIDTRPTPTHNKELANMEDIDVTNQFNVFGDVKPGLFRYFLLKSIMRLVDYFARHIYKRGFLARVRTIHFARWVFLNNNRSMYFASTYDGSLESYMDDFINKVAFGLNLTFSHGVGYPATRWMIKGGAELEQPFKSTLRRHQLPSAVWYRAYPGLTAIDMARNARIRQGLQNYPANDKAITQWLSEL